MPWGYECRKRLLKQYPWKPTKRELPISQETGIPGPDHYEPPKICGGNGFSKIKRAPAYTFGHLTKPSFQKPAVSSNAPMFNTREINQRGGYKIPGGLITPQIDPPRDKTKIPGPATYAPLLKTHKKSMPAYSLRLAAKPPYQPFDSWTPPPNMYCPPIPKRRPPAYTLGYGDRILTKAYIPGPGEHDPNFNYVKKKKPAYSFGSPFKPLMAPNTPAPTAYCEKKFMIAKRSIPTPSFGIRHTPYLGNRAVYLKSSKLDVRISEV